MDRTPNLKSLAAALADRAPWLIDAYRFALHPHWEIAIWRDYRLTWRRLGWLRELPAPAADAPVALLALRREDLFDIKSSLLLGAAMKLRGARPVVLANHRRVPRIHRYAAAFGIGTVRYRDEFPLAAEELATIERRAAQLMARDDNFAAVRAWTHRGQPLGDRVLSTLIRTTIHGEPDLSDPRVRCLLHRIVLQVLHNLHQAETILADVAPRWLLADETGYAVNGPLVDVALERDIEVLEASPYLTEGALALKRMSAAIGREATTTVSRATLESLEAQPWTAAEDTAVMRRIEERYRGGSGLQQMYQVNTRSVDREEMCRQLDLEPARPLAVVFSHVLWDASFFYGRDLFTNYREWLAETLHAAISNPRVNWLIKAHPANAFRLRHGDVAGAVGEVELVRQEVNDLPSHVRLLLPETSISSLALFRYADIGITVRGTAGLEMACVGKPVLTAGTGHYSGFGFTIDSRDRGEYLARLAHLEDLAQPLDPEQVGRARRYAWALLALRPWRMRSFELRLDYPERGWHPLDRNVVPVARSLAEARRLGDLHRFAVWAVDRHEADYLEEPEPS